ncbi:MAG TPA: hypothetical protein GX514_09150 [Thermoanaerobacterales bacterium]|nr:hypothetical protein [Thermoanaerobacterales bacterium]
MIEKVKFEDLMKFRGLVTVELFDAQTGKLQERVQKENFIAVGNKKWWALLQRNSIINKMPSALKDVLQSFEVWPSSDTFFNRICLTDYTGEEEPEKEWYLPGNLIGAIDIRNIATSTHAKAGVLNLNESFISRELIHLVGDFSTDKGNGVFQSIGFINSSEAYNSYGNHVWANLGFTEVLKYLGGGTSSNLITKMEKRLIYCNYVAGNNSTPFYYFDLENGEDLQVLFTPSSALSRTGLANNGQNLYVSQNGYTIREYALDGTLVKTITTQVPGLQGIYFDKEENVFYVTSSASGNNPIDFPWNMCLYKLNEVGEILEIIPFLLEDPSYRIRGRLSDGTFVFQSANSILFQNFERVDYSIYSFQVPTTNTYGVTVEKENNIFFGIAFSSITNYNIIKIYPAAMNSRVLLSAPQTKTNAQTMKVTYDLYYTDWTKL